MSEEIIEQVKRVVRTRSQKISEQPPEGFFNTGCVLLNLALSDKAFGGYGIGKLTNLIGDSSSGKSLLALSALAELSHDKRFDDYELVFDDVEVALEFDIKKLFGLATKVRVIPPKTNDKEEPIVSEKVEDFELQIHNRLESGKPFLYILDSLDGLPDSTELEKSEENLKKRAKGAEEKGSYGIGVPKALSGIFRRIVRRLKHSKAGLIVISQTRDNINPMSFEKKIRSGGKALRFYSCHEIWLAVGRKIKFKDKVLGTEIIAKVTKNKITGKIRTVKFFIYYDYGVDNIGSCIDFLVEERAWRERGITIYAPVLGLEGTRQKLIREIEEKGLEKNLYVETEKIWLEIENSLKLNRKPKYA